jgi:ribosomal protein S27AE
VLDPQYVFALAGALIGSGATVVVAGMRSPRRWCPGCGGVLPQFRLPTSVTQAVRGGWTCGRCDAAVDSTGRLAAAAS